MWAWAGCTHPEPFDPPPDGPEAAFDLRANAAILHAPFPSVHHFPGGRAHVVDWPGADGNPWVRAVVDTLEGAEGASRTAGILFPFTEPAAIRPVDAWSSLEDDSPAFLVAVESGERVPVDVVMQPDGGPYGADDLLVMLPVQGRPLRPGTTYAAVLRRGLGADGPLGTPAALRAALAGGTPDGWDPDVAAVYRGVSRHLPDDTAAVAVFATGDPTAAFTRFTEAARAEDVALDVPPALLEGHDTFCVFEARTSFPSYQGGEPPFATEGGDWRVDGAGEPEVQRWEPSRVFFTVPRSPTPAGGWPVAVMVRTGGGGDRPLIDRGVRDADGVVLLPGTGPAATFASAGFVGVQVDGPLGGPVRNPAGGDEQFLLFNVGNLVATRDNVRQSALELALLPTLLDGLVLDTSACEGTGPTAPLDLQHLALVGHSMGATIAPLTLAAEPAYELGVLSGFGGSYLENLVYKAAPLEVRPLAEAIVGYASRGRELTEHDAVLQLVQWAGEPADPPVYADAIGAHVLMEQGIVDHYILPPIANAGSLSLGLSLGGDALDEITAELDGMRPLGPLLPFSGGERVGLPAGPRADGRTRIVVQHREDGVEDGHEVFFQNDAPKHQLRCVLEDLAAGRDVVVVAGGAQDAACR